MNNNYKFQNDETNKNTSTETNKAKIKIFKDLTAIIVAGAIISLDIGGYQSAICTEITINKNKQTYSNMIEQYDKKIEKYAGHIKSLNLNNFQIIMKTQYDLWNSIDKYGEADCDITGYYRLAFLEDGKKGLCRHMADDIAEKLNAINPEFNARTLIVYKNIYKDYSLANIEMNQDENFISSGNTSELELMLAGNHMVVLADMPEENITLVVDPTNSSLGVFKNGAIHMFSSSDGNGYYLPIYGQCLQGISGKINYINYYKQSFTDANIEELREKYGIEAENRVLEEIKEIDNSKFKK